MKNTYIIIGGCVTVVLLLMIWAYLLVYGTPKPVENFFTDFSFSNTAVSEPIAPIIPESNNAQVDVLSTTPLRQLTTKPVIGYIEKNSLATTGTSVLYAEAGTGHVFSINLTSGTETRLSNITIPSAQSASFSNDGTMVAIRSGYGIQNIIKLITLKGENDAQEEDLLPKMVDFAFNKQNKILYTEYNSSGLLAREYDTETGVSRTIFTVPFQNATIAWSLDGATDHFVYPKPTALLPGYLYRVSNGTLVREPSVGYGLMSLTNGEYIVDTIQINNQPETRVSKNGNSTTSIALPIVMEPSKCALSPTEASIMYCGNERTAYTNDFPDEWYKGVKSYSDVLFKIDLKKGSAAQLINPETLIGRTVDVSSLNIAFGGRVLYFINKNDNTLWMYEI